MGMFLRRGPAPHRTRASDLEIGQTIKLKLNGTPWDWLVVHQGLPSSIYDNSCDGTWLLLKDIYENRQWSSTDVDGYANSTVQSYLNGDFLNLFDGNIKDAIKHVKIPYREGFTTQQGANGLPCKLFLLSAPEIHIEGRDIDASEGSALHFFASCTTNTADPKRVAYLNGQAADWCLRSTDTDEGSYTFVVGVGGGFTYGNKTNSFGIRPALILPSDFIVTDDMLTA